MLRAPRALTKNKFSTKNKEMGILIYGGSFNPPHIGHMRLAIECCERLGRLAQRVDFVPASIPPHKESRGILPFGLRVEMLRKALESLPDMRCNELESRRRGPSYSIDTLAIYKRDYPGEQLYFLLGSQDFALLPEWRRGLELPDYANLVIVPRGGFSTADFSEMTKALWKSAREDRAALAALPPKEGERACFRIDGGSLVYYFSIPYLPISASLIRSLWLQGRKVDYLTPDSVLEILEAHRKTALECWQENGRSCSM